MEDRREFFRKSLGFLAGTAIFLSPLGAFVKTVLRENEKDHPPQGNQKAVPHTEESKIHRCKEPRCDPAQRF